MKSIFILFSAIILVQSARGQGFSKAEYFFDSDPGINNGTAVTLSGAQDTINFTSAVSTAALSPGFHFLGLRLRHNDGKWGLFEKRGLYISSSTANAADITAAEYFFDTDPGVGNGTATSVGTTGAVVNFTAVIPTSLSAGFHFLAIRTKDANGIWGLFEKRGFYISSSTANAADITAAEYFFDTDPGVGNGISTSVGTNGAVVNFTAVIPTSLPAGFHFLAIRTKGTDGIWGLFEKRGFYISSSTADAANITAAEYFFDTDPGVGNGISTSVGTNGAVVNFTAVIPTSLPAGFHFLAIRTKGTDGIWGLFEKRGFYISTTTANMPIITDAEYFFDADPGIGNGIALTVNTPGNTFTQTFNIPVPLSLPDGQHFLAIRVKDQAGNWGLYEFDTLTVSGALPVTGLSLRAKKEGAKVKLDWFTLTETNTSHYDIERSFNGISFEKIGKVQAVGNSNNRTDYTFTDVLPGKNLTYYRLKQVDRDGRIVYSEIRIVKFGEEHLFKVYPVITQGLLNIEGIPEPVNIKIFSNAGQLVKIFATNNSTGTINITNLAAGMYWLVIERNGALLFTQKIIKQ